MGKDYGSWSLGHLKAELRKRNAKVTGRKATLVQRLLDYDQMFGALVNDPESTYHMEMPSVEKFKDITSDSQLPVLTQEALDIYSELGERDDLDTSRNMYNENYLLAVRDAQSGEDHYITGICAAEMRKHVTYNIAIKMQEDLILEAQCECAAGMGPHAQCKHVLVLMYAIIDFSRTKTMKLLKSPTAQLQAFHRPLKLYTGNPVLAKDLILRKKGRMKAIPNFDPRMSVPSREKYIQQFKSKLRNFAGTSKVKMSISQISKAANKIALYKDHDYMELSQENQFLRSLQLTPEQLRDLENKTKTDKKKWNKGRLTRLHSSQFGAICKCVSAQKSIAKRLLKRQDVMTLAIKHGVKYEAPALRKAEKSGLNVDKCGIFVHPNFQFIASTPDGVVNENAVIEVKCPFTAKGKIINQNTVPYIYLSEKTGDWKLNKSHNYFYQAQGQLMCTGRQICYFCIYTITDFVIIKIERDDDFINEMMNKLVTFYNEHYKHFFLCRYLYNIKF